jgi:hypothetical protein
MVIAMPHDPGKGAFPDIYFLCFPLSAVSERIIVEREHPINAGFS